MPNWKGTDRASHVGLITVAYTASIGGLVKRTLDVYWNKDHVGKLVQDEHGQLQFHYVEGWLDNSMARPISQSMPLQSASFNANHCRAYFSGILPEEDKRERVAKNLGISARNDFAMLERIGGECAGALSFITHGSKPDIVSKQFNYQPLTDLELEAILHQLPQRPLMAGEFGIRLSLAGVQDKIAVTLRNGIVSLPLHGAPSTHILKPSSDRFKGLAENEAFCLELASSIGLPTAKAELLRVGVTQNLLVERYDRELSDTGKISRLHQEDFCQALGSPPEFKYQSEGGPSAVQCFELLRRCSSNPVVDLRTLLDAIIFNYLIGNNDAHGKNFSLLYTKSGIRLAPLYDLLSTATYPELSGNMAMKIGESYEASQVSPRDWEAFAKRSGLSVALVQDRFKVIANKTLHLATRSNYSPSIVALLVRTIEQRIQREHSL